MHKSLYYLSCAIVCATCLPAHGAVMDVQYGATSWTAAGVPIAIAVDFAPSTSQVYTLSNTRIAGQTFTTVDGFTLDKIWIEYRGVETRFGYTLELRLYELIDGITNTHVDANASTLPTTLTNLFSEPQLHPVVTADMTNATDNNFAVFDVENVALKPNTPYGFFFYLTGSTGTVMKWAAYTNGNTYPGGSQFRLESNLNVEDDGIFALQYLPPAPPPTNDPPPTVVAVPEPAALTLIGLSLCMMASQRRRSQR